jgi:hypothetical protein
MPQWRERAEELLYAGESIEETVELDDAHVLVTSHRVLAFTPGADGATFQQADRPNVAGVTSGARAESGLLERGVRLGVIGGVLVVAGMVLDFGSVIGEVDLSGGEAAGQVGLGGILGTLGTVLGLLRDLDQYMGLAGGLFLLLAVGLLGLYWYLREPTLVIHVEGDEDVRVPSPAGERAAIADRLERAVAPGTGEERTGDSDRDGSSDQTY